ncbi:MAG: ABC transporter ATP-binding protein, partial [Deltaproteobacteria bacterium]|nr:ABC transporter ATP-binding protein [Deltaproteobacteria bacterium]
MKHLFTFMKTLLTAPERTPQLRLADIAFFAGFLRQSRRLAGLYGCVAVLTTALCSLLPLSSKVVIDFIILKTGYAGVETALQALGLGRLSEPVIAGLSSVSLLVALLMLAGLVIGAARMAQNMLALALQKRFVTGVQAALFEHVLRFPIALIKEKQTGYLMSRISDDVAQLEDFFSQALLNLVSKLCYVLFGLGLLYLINAPLTAVLLGVMPLFVGINLFFAARVRAVGYAELEKRARITTNIQEAMSGIEVVKSHGTEQREAARVSGGITRLFETRMQGEIMESIAQFLLSGTKFAVTLVVIWMGVNLAEEGRMTVGDLTAFSAYTFYLSSMTNMFFVSIIMLQPAVAAMHRIRELFGVAPECGTGPEGPVGIVPEQSAGVIRFDAVTHAYHKEQPVLQDIVLQVLPGETVVLSGESGVGKTTLVNLLLKFISPDRGRI